MVSGLLAACGSSSTSASTTTTGPHTTTTTTTGQTTTTLSAAQVALQPKLLTVSDFPSGWTADTQTDAVDITGAPSCVGNLVVAAGSTSRVSTAFIGPTANPAAVIQTVAAFAAGTASTAATTLGNGFLACNGQSVPVGSEQTGRLSTAPLGNVPAGTGGFAGQMTVTVGTQHEYLYAFVGVKGDLGTVLVWRSIDRSPVLFTTTAAKALAKL